MEQSKQESEFKSSCCWENSPARGSVSRRICPRVFSEAKWCIQVLLSQQSRTQQPAKLRGLLTSDQTFEPKVFFLPASSNSWNQLGHIFSVSPRVQDLRLFIFHLTAKKANCTQVITSWAFRLSGDAYHQRQSPSWVDRRQQLISEPPFQAQRKIQKELFSERVISHHKKYQLSGAGFLCVNWKQVCVKLN